MATFKVWDRKSSINGVPADHFLSREPFKSARGDIIVGYDDKTGKANEIESKHDLALGYGIDENLDAQEFMDAYIAKIKADAKAQRDKKVEALAKAKAKSAVESLAQKPAVANDAGTSAPTYEQGWADGYKAAIDEIEAELERTK